MSEQKVIFDALAMPVVDPSMIKVSLLGAFAFTAIAIVGWIRWADGADASSQVQRGKVLLSLGVMTSMAVAELGYLGFAGIQTALWRHDYDRGDYSVLDGCVANFTEAVHPDHDLGVDRFTLQGRPFTVSDSGWRLGYHLSRHHGSPIKEGVHVRALAHDGHLLRIELLPSDCPAAGGPIGSTWRMTAGERQDRTLASGRIADVRRPPRSRTAFDP